MKNVSIAMLLGCLLLQVGCAGSRPPVGQAVYVTDTIDGKQYVVSAKVEQDGRFANSISKANRTQTISGQVTESDGGYVVAIDYNCVWTNIDGRVRLSTRVHLKEGQSQKLGGVMGKMGKEVVQIKISSK